MFTSGNSTNSIQPPSSHRHNNKHHPNNPHQHQPLHKSKSLLYRNRSLKQFFGDLPALNSQQMTQVKNIQKQNEKVTPKQALYQKGRKQAIEDEYLIKRKEKPSKHIKNERLNNLNNDSKYKRRDTVDNYAKPQAHTQTHSHFYDPSPYQWRKSKSKSKHQLQLNHHSPHNQPLIVQSEYYPTPKSSRNYNMQNEYNPIQAQTRQQTRSNSSDSVKKRKESHLKPRVSKHIFEGKAVKKKSEDADKRLLFTFGI